VQTVSAASVKNMMDMVEAKMDQLADGTAQLLQKVGSNVENANVMEEGQVKEVREDASRRSKEVKEMGKKVKEMGKEIKQFRETSVKQLQDMGTSVNDIRFLSKKAQSEFQMMCGLVNTHLGAIENGVKVMSENASRSLAIIEEQSMGQREDANTHYDLMRDSVKEVLNCVDKVQKAFTDEFLPRANNLVDNMNIVMKIVIFLLLLLAIYALYWIRSRIGSELFSICGYLMELVLLFCVAQILAKIVYQFVNGENIEKELSWQIAGVTTVGLLVLIIIAHCRPVPVINNRADFTYNRNPVAQAIG
jgi:uncharacterized membrane protein (DUF485 family)